MEVKLGIVSGREDRTHRGRSIAQRMLQAILCDDTDVQTVQLIQQFGDECNPPDGTLVATWQAGTAYKLGISAEDVIAPIMEVGGRRIYSTAADGAVVTGQIQLQPDGTILVSNPGGTITLTPAGLLTISPTDKTVINGDVIVNGDVIANGVSLTTHVHIDGGGVGNSGVPA